MKNLINTAIALALVLGMTSCSDDDTPEQINEEELINEVTLTITETGTASPMVYTWELGEATAPIVLEAEKTYNVEVGFFDATNPGDKENITEEVIIEADEHQVFYENSVSGLTINYAANDFEDSMSNKLGVRTTWTTGSGTTNGNVVVYLIHEPTSKLGTSRDDLGGETDVEVPFTVTVN